MFPARFHIAVISSLRAPARPGVGAVHRVSSSGVLFRVAVLPAMLALGLPSGASAQALGTMQVTASVLPGKPSWSGLSEAQNLARRVLQAPWSGPATSRTELVHSRAEFEVVNGRRRMLVTIHYPQN